MQEFTNTGVLTTFGPFLDEFEFLNFSYRDITFLKFDVSTELPP